MTPLISIKNASYNYDTENSLDLAVNNISLDIESGGFIAVLGHNGSGKSTLAKMLNGLLVPTVGNVYVNGVDTRDESKSIEVKKTVGMVFQNPDNQLVATIVDEDVAFGLENIGVQHDEIVERVDLALCQVGMSEYKTSAPHNLSGGQKQRIAIAGVLAMRPTCIVFDEPTSMLDPQGRKDVIDTIVSLSREQGITVVLITHFMEEAVLADRVVVMNDGKIELDGTPEYVFSEVDLLKSIGLEVPASKELLYMLKNKGVDIDISALDENKCIEIITEYLRRENNE